MLPLKSLWTLSYVVAVLNKESTMLVDKHEDTLLHLFNHKQPTPEQVHDFINFMEIGQREFEFQVEYSILRNPSVPPPRQW